MGELSWHLPNEVCTRHPECVELAKNYAAAADNLNYLKLVDSLSIKDIPRQAVRNLFESGEDKEERVGYLRDSFDAVDLLFFISALSSILFFILAYPGLSIILIPLTLALLTFASSSIRALKELLTTRKHFKQVTSRETNGKNAIRVLQQVNLEKYVLVAGQHKHSDKTMNDEINLRFLSDLDKIKDAIAMDYNDFHNNIYNKSAKVAEEALERANESLSEAEESIENGTASDAAALPQAYSSRVHALEMGILSAKTVYPNYNPGVRVTRSGVAADSAKGAFGEAMVSLKGPQSRVQDVVRGQRQPLGPGSNECGEWCDCNSCDGDDVNGAYKLNGVHTFEEDSVDLDVPEYDNKYPLPF